MSLSIGWRCNRCGELNLPNLRSRAEYKVCENCETERDWEYDGPEDIDYDRPTVQEQYEAAWRQKQELKGRRRL